MNTFLIAEKFYSVQCEGISTGYPSYFIRLTNCNLYCGSSPKELQSIRKNPENYVGGDFQGELHKEGKATWTCDTLRVWLKGGETTFQQIIDDWKAEEIYDYVKSGVIHVIWTGGEPTLPKHQDTIVEFTKWWKEQDPTITPYYEIETNGTLFIKHELFELLDQINCSPKLENSGNPFLIRYNEKSLKRIMEHKNYQFKFVISEENDLKEIFELYINKFNIPLKNVICMPGLDAQENFHERTRFVLEMARKYKFIGLTRLHISAWDKTTGV
jgi:organic radical activating enzyme